MTNKKMDVIIKCPKLSYEHAKYTLRGRFKEGEAAIATNACFSCNYAEYILKGPFKEGEKAIATDSHYSYWYAVYVIKDRFKLGEKAILEDRQLAKRYNYFLENIKKCVEEENAECGICGANCVLRTKNHTFPKKGYDGKSITVENLKFYQCTNKSCDHSWYIKEDALRLKKEFKRRINPPTEIGSKTEGAKRDDGGKTSWNYFPIFLFEDVMKVADFGAGKYGDYNCFKGMKQTRILDSLIRHYAAHVDPDKSDIDDESKQYHLAHVAWNALYALYCLKKYKELDNRYKGEV